MKMKIIYTKNAETRNMAITVSSVELQDELSIEFLINDNKTDNDKSSETTDNVIFPVANNCDSIKTAATRDESIVHTTNTSNDATNNSEDTSTDTGIFSEDNTSNSKTDTEITTSSIFHEDIYEEQEEMLTTKKNSTTVKTTAKKTVSVKEKLSCNDCPPTSLTNSVIEKHFVDNGYIIFESSTTQTIEGLKSLTYYIGENFSLTAPLLKEARKAICAPNKKGDRILNFTIEKSDSAFYHQIAGKLKQYGIFTKYLINKNVLTATISPVPKVINYLTGQWLEMYSAYILEDVVGEFAKVHGYEYEILMNVKVSNINSCGVCSHELDAVMSIDDKCFAFEMKSGSQFDDYFHLYNTRKDLHFVPDRYLLLSTSLDEEEALTLQYYYEFYITGMCGFKNRLIEMIDKAFNSP